ncbi:MAG TPA: lipoyl(octanoyl) transferase LipB [Candidatus Dormibacteraeota bacterium]|nr:lipoyl(octanoyl) transferase LipB [Candidatus Dormibacteraeota bacterium]
MKRCLVVDLGVMAYGRALELQQRLAEARKAGAAPDVLLLCEHPHVITLGRNGRREHLRAPDRLLSQMGVEFHPTNRGGDITYHGPGQVVGYPIVHVGEIRRDVVWYVRQLEEILIRTSADFGVAARRETGLTGVWVDAPGRGPEKLAAIGVHFSRWVSTHGFAYNVSTDLHYFDLIVPCGIADRGVTSLERILRRPVEPAAFRPQVARRFGEAFGFEMEPATLDQLEEQLEPSEIPTGLPASRG